MGIDGGIHGVEPTYEQVIDVLIRFLYCAKNLWSSSQSDIMYLLIGSGESP